MPGDAGAHPGSRPSGGGHGAGQRGAPPERWCRGCGIRWRPCRTCAPSTWPKGSGLLLLALRSLSGALQAGRLCQWPAGSDAGQSGDAGAASGGLPPTGGEYSVLVGIDGYYLHNILDMLSRNSPLTLVIGAQSMLADGQIHDEVPPVALGSLEQTSGKYPFRVVTDLSTTNTAAISGTTLGPVSSSTHCWVCWRAAWSTGWPAVRPHPPRSCDERWISGSSSLSATRGDR